MNAESGLEIVQDTALTQSNAGFLENYGTAISETGNLLPWQKHHTRQLRDDFVWAVKLCPRLVELREKLLSLGGVELVVHDHLNLTRLRAVLENGCVQDGPVVQFPGKPQRCHTNVARLCATGHPALVGFGTGYALSDEGLWWYEHSWGILAAKDDQPERLLETTPIRWRRYFRSG